jgi:hypothetical protein
MLVQFAAKGGRDASRVCFIAKTLQAAAINGIVDECGGANELE